MNYNHSPERDEEVFRIVAKWAGEVEVTETIEDQVLELIAIAKKWRAKATMRAAKIEDLEQEVSDLTDAIELSGVDVSEVLEQVKDNS